MKRIVVASLILPVAIAGCSGIAPREERQARQEVQSVAQQYRPQGQRPELPPLTADSHLEDFLRFAVLNQPRVEAAYYNWAAAVENITVARSLPDPQLTFQADILDMLVSAMPGIMQQFPGPGKLKARAASATAMSQARYVALETAVLQAAFDLKKSYYELGFLDERLRIDRETLALLDDLERTARAQNETGKATLQDVLRTQIERDRVSTEIANLEDSRTALRANFKAALGLTPDQPDPPPPAKLDLSPALPSDAELWQAALARNPDLKAMAAEIRTAQAGIAVAYKDRVPDFSLGLMVDVKTSPTMLRPLGGMTLPIWRDKLAAELAQARAQELAARSQWNAAQISLAMTFAEKTFGYREINRNLDLLQERLVPKARQSLELARANYLAGTLDFFNLMDAQRTLLMFELTEVEARTQREIIMADLSLLIAGTPPASNLLPSNILQP